MQLTITWLPRLTLLKNKDVYKQFLDSPNRKKFHEEHSAEIILYEAARRELQELTGQKKFPSLKDIKTERTTLYQQKPAQYEAYSEAHAHDKELANIEANMNVILDRDKPEITKDKFISIDSLRPWLDEPEPLIQLEHASNISA